MAISVTLPTQRLHSLDAFRSITIAGMILVNNPGSWRYVYAPLRHAAAHKRCLPARNGIHGTQQNQVARLRLTIDDLPPSSPAAQASAPSPDAPARLFTNRFQPVPGVVLQVLEP